MRAGVCGERPARGGSRSFPLLFAPPTVTGTFPGPSDLEFGASAGTLGSHVPLSQEVASRYGRYVGKCLPLVGGGARRWMASGSHHPCPGPGGRGGGVAGLIRRGSLGGILSGFGVRPVNRDPRERTVAGGGGVVGYGNGRPVCLPTAGNDLPARGTAPAPPSRHKHEARPKGGATQIEFLHHRIFSHRITLPELKHAAIPVKVAPRAHLTNLSPRSPPGA